MTFKLKFAKLDAVVISIITIISIILSIVVLVPWQSGQSVAVYIQGKMEYSLALDVNQTLTLHPGEYNKETNTFPSLLGEMVIEIQDKRIRVEKEESPLHVCSRQGWVSTPNIPLTCSPNSVLIVIESAQVTNPDITI